MRDWTARRAVLTCLVAAALLTLPRLGARDLWAPDEPRYAQVAQEMLTAGHWWFPHVNSRPYPDKPPLYFWLAAAAGAPAGRVGEAAARLPSALAHLLLVALTFHLGRRFWGVSGGLIAGLALATTWLPAWMARRASLDVLLALCATAAIAAALHGGDAARRGSRPGLLAWSAAAGGACALGVMTKGPVVLLAIVGACLPLALHRQLRATRPRGSARLGVLVFAAACAAVLAGWLVTAHRLAGYDAFAVTRKHVVERAAEGMHHAQPAWYFLTTLPVDFLPWTLLAIPALAWGWRRRGEWPQAMLLGWALLPLLAHSLIVEKRNIYVLPMAPAWALLCAGWMASQVEAPPGLRRALAVLVALLAALALGMSSVLVLPLGGKVAEARALPGVDAGLVLVVLAAVAGAVLLAASLARRAGPVVLALAVTLSFGLLEASLFHFLPRLDPLKSGRAMGLAIREHASGAPIAMHPRTWDAYVYYSGRRIADLGEGEAAARWLAAAGRPAFVLAYEKNLAELPPDGPVPPRSVASADVGHRRVHLLAYERVPESP